MMNNCLTSLKKKHLLRAQIMLVAVFSMAIVGCKKTPSENKPMSSSSSTPVEEEYHIVRPEFTPEYDTFAVSEKPSGVNMTYYNDIYSRGFSWLTDENTPDTDLYLVESDEGENADFDSGDYYQGESLKLMYATDGNLTTENDVLPKTKGSSNSKALNCYSHKVHVENLKKGKAYSYRIGSEKGWSYGAFIVEKDTPKGIQVVHMSDAQTKDLSKHTIWRNTFTHAIDTAGKDLDMVLYNGDQFDQNIKSGTNPVRILKYAKAYDVISDYKFNLPYMASSGNHEPSTPFAQYIMSDVKYAGFDYKGAYYSYDYDFAHFVVLNTNTVDETQISWLQQDLEAASTAKWKIVMLHISPYSTGDHSNDSENKNIVQKLTPIFSAKHVDLVLQAHDHTYNKTLPYKWDSVGYTTTWNNANVVNLEPETEVKNNVTYDKNPEGTYYVTTGAAGHRCGEAEEDGIWAEVVKDGETYKGLNPNKTFLDNTYKIELGKITVENEYKPYTFGSYTSDQKYEIGDLATGNVNAQMFGVLSLSEETMSYHVYTVNDDTVKLFDTLDVLKA